MVGSITFTKKEGDYVKKGDEVHNNGLCIQLLFIFDSTIELNLIVLLLIFCAVWIFLIWWKYGHLCF